MGAFLSVVVHQEPGRANQLVRQTHRKQLRDGSLANRSWYYPDVEQVARNGSFDISSMDIKPSLFASRSCMWSFPGARCTQS